MASPPPQGSFSGNQSGSQHENPSVSGPPGSPAGSRPSTPSSDYAAPGGNNGGCIGCGGGAGGKSHGCTEPNCPNMNSFDDMRVQCPGCNAQCSLKIRFKYFGLNREDPLEQEIRYFISLTEPGNRPSSPAAHAPMSPQSQQQPTEYKAKYYQSFERMALECPACHRALNLKTGFSYIGPNHENRHEHDIKLRIKVTGDGMTSAPNSRPTSPGGQNC